ncbi:hypothetical protein D3C85_1255750 [compost metagenome]
MLEGVAHFLLPQAVGSVEPFVSRQQQETKAITEVAAGHIQAQQQETLARREAAQFFAQRLLVDTAFLAVFIHTTGIRCFAVPLKDKQRATFATAWVVL